MEGLLSTGPIPSSFSLSSAVQLTAHGVLYIVVETVLHCSGLMIATADLYCTVQLSVRHLFFWIQTKMPDKH